MIGDGSHISIFGDSWIANCRLLVVEDTSVFNPFLRVSYLLHVGTKSWNMDVINY